HNAIQTKISNNKWTTTEFSNYVQSNQVDIKQLIVDNLWVSNNTPISSNRIGSVSVSGQNLVINLSPASNTKFSISSSSNFELNENVLIIKNFIFSTITNFTRLNDLYNAINNEIQTRNFTSSDFETYVSQNESAIKQLIADNLYISQTDKFDINNINSVSMSGSNLVVSLKEIQNVKYSANNTANVVLSNNNITISNLRYSTITKLVKLNVLHSAIQAEITSRKFTSSEFSNYLNTNNQSIKTIIANNLYISESNTIGSGLISNVTYSNGVLNVSLVRQNGIKYAIDNNLNFSLNDNVLTISNFNYFTIVNLTNLNSLHTAINNDISSKKITSSEFSNYVQSDQSSIKQIIANNLWTANNTTISATQIGSISSNGQNLVVNLLPNLNTKFSMSSNSNFTLNENVLTIKNFTFTTITNFTRLSDLYNAVNNDIKTRNYNSSEYTSYVTSNQTAIKQLIANNLYTSATNRFSVSNINSVSMSGTNLVITLNNIANVKYSADVYSNVVLNNNVLTISNLYYSQTINLTRLDVLWTAINNYIAESNRKYTLDEFRNVINSSPSTIKQLVKDNLYINTNTTISLDKISSVSINANNQFEITLDTTLTKYTISSYTNASLSSNKLIIKNLNYFNLISISD
ncbi:MAG: hypothetical protein K2L64_02920, partial [Ureaplasma sp.]|nr:hypothetical protein [Ureaplasma sp.]